MLVNSLQHGIVAEMWDIHIEFYYRSTLIEYNYITHVWLRQL